CARLARGREPNSAGGVRLATPGRPGDGPVTLGVVNAAGAFPMIDLTTLFRNATAVTKRAGEVLFEAGSPGTEMYVVRTGEIAIHLGNTVVERVGPGSLLGEMALIDNSPRSATAIASQDSEVIAIDQKQFLFMVQQTPFFAIQVMRVMAARLRAM